MKKFLFLIPVLFLFVGCELFTPCKTTVENSTDNDVQIYFNDSTEKIYTVPANSSITIDIDCRGFIYGYNFPENYRIKCVNNFNYVIWVYAPSLKSYTVYNTFSVPILFKYNNNQTEINPGDSFSFDCSSLVYSFYYNFNGTLVEGDNNNLIIKNINLD